MKLPETVYHGTFCPLGKEFNSDYLVTPTGYVSTTEIREWARYFARLKRFQFASEEGVLTIYIVETSSLPTEVLEKCIPPGKYDPRAKAEERLLIEEKKLRGDRIRMREWRFPYIPLHSTKTISSYEHPESPFIASTRALEARFFAMRSS